jgi:hypothetical protein
MTESYPPHYRPRDTPRGQSQAATRFWHREKDRYCPITLFAKERLMYLPHSERKRTCNDRLSTFFICHPMEDDL